MCFILRNKALTCILLFFLASGVVSGQEDKENKEFLNTEEPEFLLEQDTLSYVKKKKKKRKKKTFNGLKTRRGFTRKGAGRRETVELFYYLKRYRKPSEFVTPIYLFEIDKMEIVEVDDYDKKKYPPRDFRVLHGPYEQRRDTNVLVSGYYYIGTKHHRWEHYGNDQIVELKENFYKGWPADSRVTYYDAKKKQPKEVIPYMYGEKTGTYYYYFENGDVKTRGRYENGIKVGKWEEFWEDTHKRKSLKIYPKDPYVEDRTPKVIGEWNKDGTRKGVKNKPKKLGGGR